MLRFPSPRVGAVLVSVVAWLACTGPATAASLLCGTAGDELVAARAGLTREWVVQIPFDSAGWRLEHVSVGDGLVVATSGDGGVHAVQASSAAVGSPRVGSVVWSQRVGRPGGPVQPAGIGPGIVTVARDLDLYAFDADDGSQKWHRAFGRPPAAAAVPSGDFVYGPLDGDGVMRMPVNPTVRPEPVSARSRTGRNGPTAGVEKRQKAGDPLLPLALDAGGRVNASPIPYQGGVVWCTDDGIVVAIVPAESDQPSGSDWTRMEFDLGSSPAGPLVVRGSVIYAATTRGDLARIEDVKTTETHVFSATWHVVLPQPATGGPLVGGDTVVVSLGDEGTMAFSAETGVERWRSCAAGTMLSVSGDRVWCLDRVGRLSSLDLATGAPSEWMCLGSFTLPVVNTVNDRLILASPDGLLVSLAPRRTTSALPAAEPEAIVPPDPAAGDRSPTDRGQDEPAPDASDPDATPT
jgi:outer membrane protein assembly factor BamB